MLGANLEIVRAWAIIPLLRDFHPRTGMMSANTIFRQVAFTGPLKPLCAR